MYLEYMRFALKYDLVTITLGELSKLVPIGRHLQYRIQVFHDDQLIKEIEIATFHLALFTFHKSIDAEVRANVQG